MSKRVRPYLKGILSSLLLLSQLSAQASLLPLPNDPRGDDFGLWRVKEDYGFYRMAEGLFHERREALHDCTLVKKALLFQDPTNRNKATLYLKPAFYGQCLEEVNNEDIIKRLSQTQVVKMVRLNSQVMGESERWLGLSMNDDVRQPSPEKVELVIEIPRGRGTLYINPLSSNTNSEQAWDLIFPLLERIPEWRREPRNPLPEFIQ